MRAEGCVRVSDLDRPERGLLSGVVAVTGEGCARDGQRRTAKPPVERGRRTPGAIVTVLERSHLAPGPAKRNAVDQAFGLMARLSRKGSVGGGKANRRCRLGEGSHRVYLEAEPEKCRRGGKC